MILLLVLLVILSLGTTSVSSSSCPFSSTATLPSLVSVTYNGNNANQGLATSAPICQANANHQDILVYVPPVTGWYVIDTFNSMFDTVLSVSQNCSSDSLACNDDAPGVSTSSLALFMTQNVTYRISVYGFATFAQGSYQVHINPQGPTASPTAGVCAPSSYTFPSDSTLPQFIIGTQSVAGSTSLPIPTCQGNVLTATWFDYTPPTTSLVAVNTLGSAFDTVLIVYGEETCSTQIACSDDILGLAQSFVVVPMMGGVRYRLVVLGYSSNPSGLYRLEISSNVTIPGDPNSLVYRVDHGLCYGLAACECDPGWIGPLCATAPTASPSATLSPATMPTLTPIVSNADIVNGLILGLVLLLVLGLVLYGIDVYYCGGGAAATTSHVVNRIVVTTMDTAGRVGGTAMREMGRVANSAMSGQLPTFSSSSASNNNNINNGSTSPEFDDVMSEQPAGAPRMLGGPGGAERRRSVADEEQNNLIVI